MAQKNGAGALQQENKIVIVDCREIIYGRGMSLVVDGTQVGRDD